MQGGAYLYLDGKKFQDQLAMQCGFVNFVK